MVRVVNCHAGVLGSNPGGPKDFPLWNCFNGVRSNSVMPEATSESESGSGLYFWVQILVDPKIFPFGIALVSSVLALTNSTSQLPR